MNKKLLLTLTLLLVTATAGCSLAPYEKSPKESMPLGSQTPVSGDPGVIKRKLYAQHREWRGTRYALGGMSKRGIDCSGLVQTTYREHLGIELPRTTEYQALVGKAIRRSDLRAGDLVFFKTGRKLRHVGIYIEDGKFFHASTSKGVMISRLTDYYWRDKYWHARRVALDTPRILMGK